MWITWGYPSISQVVYANRLKHAEKSKDCIPEAGQSDFVLVMFALADMKLTARKLTPGF